MERLIYALKCPITEQIHYVGRSTQGMRRPMQHMKSSHSKKIKEWVSDLSELSYKPLIIILEYINSSDDIDVRERFWINKCIDDGCVLLNENLVIPIILRSDLGSRLDESLVDSYKSIGRFVAERRKILGYTQVDFAEKIGMGLKFLRKVEQHETHLRVDKLLDLLYFFGCTIKVEKV